MNRTRASLLSILALASLFLSAPLAAETDSEEGKRFVSAARSSLARFLVDPEMAWFKEHLDQARAVLIVPKRVRAGLIIGGHGGVGILIAKDTADRRLGPAGLLQPRRRLVRLPGRR